MASSGDEIDEASHVQPHMGSPLRREPLCPSLVVPRGSECVMLIATHPFGITSSSTTVEIMDQQGAVKLVARVQLPHPPGRLNEAPGLVLRLPQPDASACDDGTCLCRSQVVASSHMQEACISNTDGQTYGTLTREQGGYSERRYVFKDGCSSAAFFIDKSAETVSVTDTAGQNIANTEPWTGDSDEPSNISKLLVAEDNDVGLILCAILTTLLMENFPDAGAAVNTAHGHVKGATVWDEKTLRAALRHGADEPIDAQSLRQALRNAHDIVEAAHQAATKCWRSPLSLFGERAEREASNRGVPSWSIAIVRQAQRLVEEAAAVKDLTDAYEAQVEMAKRMEHTLSRTALLAQLERCEELAERLQGLLPQLQTARDAFDNPSEARFTQDEAITRIASASSTNSISEETRVEAPVQIFRPAFGRSISGKMLSAISWAAGTAAGAALDMALEVAEAASGAAGGSLEKALDDEDVDESSAR